MLAPNNTLQNGRYRIIRHLGGGGQGNVYEAHDTRLNNNVAIKEALGNDPVSQEIFEKEAQRLDRLRHSALPNVIDRFIEGRGQYLVMEFIPGQDLGQMLKERTQPFSVEEVVAWGEQLLDALIYLHQRRVIHRDIKPANLKLTPEREIVLLDFGLAKGGLTKKSSSVKGFTFGFAPLEQMTEQTTDKRSDLYSLGATLYALLTKSTPANPFKRVVANSEGEPDPLRPANELNPQVPPHIAEALTRAMAVKAEQRPTSAKEMLALLTPPPPPPTQPTKPPRRADSFAKPVKPPPSRADHLAKTVNRRPTWLPWALGGVAAVLLAAIVVGLATMMSGGNGEGESANGPQSTATSEPSPTPAFPLLAGTPLPPSLAIISAENASELREVARLGKGRVIEVAYSPDGKLLAVGSSIGIYLYDADTLEEIRFLDSQEWISAIAFSPDGMLLAADGPSNSIQLWQVNDGQLLATLEGHRSPVESVSFSPDGEWLASGSDDRTVRLWRVSDGQLLATLEGHTSPVESVSFSPDGQWLASGSGDDTVRLWRSDNGQLLATGMPARLTLEGHTEPVYSVSFSPDGEWLASASDDDTVRLWRSDNGQLLATLEGHTSPVESVSFSPDGEWLASASWDNTVRLWRVSDGQLLATLEGHTSSVWSVSFSPDGRLLASGSGDGTIRLWGVVE